MKKLLSLLLILCLLCSLGGSLAFGEDAARSRDIVILYTGDIHCGIDENFGYAGLEAVREYLVNAGNEVILVDVGDNIQGEAVGTMTKGAALTELMNKMGYSVAIPGNHEFDYGMQNFLDLAKAASFDYVSCNFNHEGALVFKPYVIRELDGAKVAFVGVTTPQTLTDSTPANFQDENGNFVYGFLEDASGEKVYDAVQSAVDAARAEGADYVIVLAHLGLNESARPWTYADVIEHTEGYDAMLDGHSHDTEQVVMKNRAGVEVPRSASGTKLQCVGWCRIAVDGKVTAGVYTWTNPDSVPKMLGVKNEMSDAVEAAKDQLDAKLGEVVASSAVDLTIFDPTETDANGNPIRMVRRAETNLGDLCADACRQQTGAQIAFVNGGGIRTDIKAGDITLNDIYSVFPFNNGLVMIEATGQQILDALEWSAHGIPDEFGGFLQVAGISFEIHSYIESSCTTDENSMFAGVAGERRVKNVLVGGEPIDPEATYTVAGYNFTLTGNGDGYTAFDGAKLVLDRIKLDNQVMIDYITDVLGGVIGPQYEDATGDGRIVIVEQAP